MLVSPRTFSESNESEYLRQRETALLALPLARAINNSEAIVIPSEEVWYLPEKQIPARRVFLRRKDRIGFLKVVSEDTNGKFFRLNIIASPFDVRISPASKSDWEGANA